MAKTRSPFGAKLALVVAALGLGTMLIDRKGTGADPVVRRSTGLIGAGGAIWLVWAALKQQFSRRA